MRRGGQRLPRTEIMATEPRRGELLITPIPGARDPLPVASLLGPDLMTYLLPPLTQARVLCHSQSGGSAGGFTQEPAGGSPHGDGGPRGLPDQANSPTDH